MFLILQGLPKKIQHSKVDVGITSLQCPWYLLSLSYKDTKIQFWTLVLQTCSARENTYSARENAHDTMQRHKHSIVDVGVANLPCPWNLQSLPYKDTKKSRVGVGKTYSVLKSAKSFYHSKIQEFKGGRWRYKLTVCLKLARSILQRYINSRVDVVVTSLQCPWNLQDLQ